MKEEYETSRAILEQVAKENPDAILNWISGELESGKFLVLPAAIYDDCVKLAKEHGMSDKAIANLHKSSWIPSSGLRL